MRNYPSKPQGSGGFNTFLLKKLKVMKKSVYSSDKDGEEFCREVFFPNNEAKERVILMIKDFKKNRSQSLHKRIEF